MKEEYSAGGIVYRKKEGKIQILFILDPYGKWAFPKGHIENETTQDAAIREVSEETGIKLKKIKLIQKIGSTDFWFTFENKQIHKFLDLFLMEVEPDIEPKPQIEEKIKEVKWVDMDQAVEVFGYDNGREILLKGIEAIKKRYGV